MAKTTIELSDDLMQRAKALAARRGTTLRALIEQGLRNEIRSQRERKPFALRDAAVNGKGLQPAFRNREWASIRSAIYEGRGE